VRQPGLYLCAGKADASPHNVELVAGSQGEEVVGSRDTRLRTGRRDAELRPNGVLSRTLLYVLVLSGFGLDVAALLRARLCITGLLRTRLCITALLRTWLYIIALLRNRLSIVALLRSWLSIIAPVRTRLCTRFVCGGRYPLSRQVRRRSRLVQLHIDRGRKFTDVRRRRIQFRCGCPGWQRELSYQHNGQQVCKPGMNTSIPVRH